MKGDLKYKGKDGRMHPGYGLSYCDACGTEISKRNKNGICRECQYRINHANDKW